MDGKTYGRISAPSPCDYTKNMYNKSRPQRKTLRDETETTTWKNAIWF